MGNSFLKICVIVFVVLVGLKLSLAFLYFLGGLWHILISTLFISGVIWLVLLLFGKKTEA
jgi:hypothetical protein